MNDRIARLRIDFCKFFRNIRFCEDRQINVYFLTILHTFQVILGTAFKLFKKIANESNWALEQCWQVNRGEELSPVISCEG